MRNNTLSEFRKLARAHAAVIDLISDQKKNICVPLHELV
jgi:hypothetical protein